MRVLEFKLNNQRVEVTNPEDLGLRFDRIAQAKDNLAVKGSDFSTTITIPKTKNNNRLFLSKDVLGGLNKFNALNDYIAEIIVDGERLILGTFRLNRITVNGYEGEIRSASGNWIEKLDGYQLNDLGKVDGIPTWFFGFIGAATINSANSAPIGTYPLVFPTLVYNNTPLTDYYDVSDVSIFGTYDVDCNQLVAPKDYPNDFLLRNGYFGWREGLTFEDFPPAIHYSTLIRKCFEEIGWDVKGQIFNEEWFNALVMPHTGEDYRYNWKTLGTLTTDLIENDESAANPTEFPGYENWKQIATPLPASLAQMHTPNIGYWDDITTRNDVIANFNKYLVTDESVGKLKGGGYVAPATGRYKIRVKSFYFKELIPDGAPGAADLDAFGNAVANFGWDDNVLLITRRNQEGDLVFTYDGENTDFRDTVARWMGQESTQFVENPSDVIAYCSPKRVAALGAGDIDATGSPLTDWTETVNVLASSHTIINNTALIKSCESSAEIEIEVDLQKNERINFYWTSLINTFGASLNSVSSSNTQLNNLVSELEVEYLCGYEDIDIADNLPDISAKDFISSFINQFNLHFNVIENSNIVEFVLPNTFYSTNEQAYDISSRVEEDSIVIEPLNSPKRLVIGYENDDNDYLLSDEVASCDVTSTTKPSNYGNVTLEPNDNIYSDGDLNIKTIFSATRFVDGKFELTDVTGGVTVGTRTNPYPECNGYPVAFNNYWKFTDGETLTYKVPSIQSQSSFDQQVLSDLEYSYNYRPRILYFLGTAANYYGTDPNLQIKIDSRGPVLGSEDFGVQPTVLSFDSENGNPYPSLMYDVYLYDAYFDNLIEKYNKSYVLECQVALRASDWNNLKANRLIKLYDNIYTLLEIKEFDPLEDNFATIVMMKVI